VGVYSDLEAVFSHVAPRADCVADDGDVVVCHFTEGGAESQDGWLVKMNLWERNMDSFNERCGKRQMLCLEILWNWMDGFCLIIIIRLARNESEQERQINW